MIYFCFVYRNIYRHGNVEWSLRMIAFLTGCNKHTYNIWKWDFFVQFLTNFNSHLVHLHVWVQASCCLYMFSGERTIVMKFRNRPYGTQNYTTAIVYSITWITLRVPFGSNIPNSHLTYCGCVFYSSQILCWPRLTANNQAPPKRRRSIWRSRLPEPFPMLLLILLLLQLLLLLLLLLGNQSKTITTQTHTRRIHSSLIRLFERVFIVHKYQCMSSLYTPN